MTTINVEVPDSIANQLKTKEVITIDNLYELDDNSDKWTSIKVGEKASNILTFLKKIK